MDYFDSYMTSVYLTTLHLQITKLYPSFQELSIESLSKSNIPCKAHAKYLPEVGRLTTNSWKASF